MSGFLLCWQREGGAIDAALALDAAARLAQGSRRTVRRSEGPGWLAFHAAGAAGLTSEGQLPCEERGWVATGVLRLDDRGALTARLRDAGYDGSTDDASLAVRSFAAWQDAAPGRWMGDYAVAALAPDRDRLLIARGTFGVRSCFIARAGALELVSDDLALLAALPGVDVGVREQAVLEFLRAGELASPTLTFFRGIDRVPASHTMRIKRDGTRAIARHWEFPQVVARNDAPAAAIVEEFHDVLGVAVRDRLRGASATVLMSGGLDSPALMQTAWQVAPESGLSALTVSWDHLLPDEEPRWATMAARAIGVSHAVMEMHPDIGLRFDDDYATPEPVTDPEPAIWRAVAGELAVRGPIAFLGEDVDALLTPPTLAQQLRDDGFARTSTAWMHHRLVHGRFPWSGLRRAIPRAFTRTVSAPSPESVRGPDWLRANSRAAIAAPAPEPVTHPSRAEAVFALTQPTWEALWWQNDPAASGADVRILLPYLDPRVIAFAFSLPAVPWLQQKHLLRKAFEMRLPHELLARPKSSLGGYYAERIRRWRALGAPAPLPAPVDAWVDVARWRGVLEQATDTDEVLAAWRVIELSRWLAHGMGR